jgi:thiamine-monophosphate kinase
VAEFDLIATIRGLCAHARGDVAVGIGDDAALLAVPPGQLLAVSTDTLVAGIHFPQSTSARDVGWKSLAVNLSDLAAMGAVPAWATLALTLPQSDARWVEEFADGFAELARTHELALVGGDTTQGPLSITVTIHGLVPEGAALLRSGARVGDGVFVTGTLGDAAAGLHLLGADVQGNMDTFAALGAQPSILALAARLNSPVPRVAQGLLLRERASACIDVSDGLLADLGHVCSASGVGAEIEVDALPASRALHDLFDRDARRAFQLSGGDDYELCFTASEVSADALLADLARSGCAATRIGRIVAEPGVRVRDSGGKLLALPRAGWEHFA